MKITFKEIESETQWIHREILKTLPNSIILKTLPNDLILKTLEDKFLEVKLLINGVEVEPTMFNDIMTNIEEYVEGIVEVNCRIKLSKIFNKLRNIDENIQEVFNNIREEFLYNSED